MAKKKATKKKTASRKKAPVKKKKTTRRVSGRTTAKRSSQKSTSRTRSPRRKNSLALAAVALILNALIFPLPGIGSLLGGRTRAGIWQIVLGLIGDLLFYFWIGIPIWAFAWIWGIVTGIQLIKEAE